MKNPPKRPQHNPSTLDTLARKKKTDQTAFEVKMLKIPLLVTSVNTVWTASKKKKNLDSIFNYEINTRYI